MFGGSAMTIFDRERQKRAEEERKQAEAAAKQRQAEDVSFLR